MVTNSQCSYSCNTILVVANLLLSASLSKHPMDVYSYATEEHRDFKSLYKNVADYKSATTEKTMPHHATHIVQTSNTGTNACGRLLRVDDGTGYQFFSYDKLGNVSENIRTFAV